MINAPRRALNGEKGKVRLAGKRQARLSYAEEAVQEQWSHYVAVDVASFRYGATLDFELYIAVDGRPVLYTDQSSGVLGRQAALKLAGNAVRTVYINADERDRYLDYMQEHLSQVLSDLSLPSSQRAAALHSTTTNLVQKIFEEPITGRAVRRAEKIVSTMVEHLYKVEDLFPSVFGLVSHHYYTYTHSVNVTIYAIALAQHLRISDSEFVNDLGVGGLLHDLGKSKIDRKILDKRSHLSDSEWVLMRQHPIWGVELLGQVADIKEVTRRAILEHHERCDASGYPYGLEKREISLEGRILAVVDVYAALTSNRSYRNGFKPFGALELMKKEIGRGLDQEIFRDFVLLLGGQ